MHTMIVSTSALQSAGVSLTEPDPFGGVYDRFPGTDIINGRIHEYALYNFVRYVTMQVPNQQLRQVYQQYIEAAAILGVTSVQDLPVGLTNQRAIEVLEGMDLKIRVRLINCPMTLEEAGQVPPGFLIRPPWSKLTTTGVKWFNDGTVIDRIGAVNEPYLDRPGWYGLFNFPLDIYDLMVADGLKSPAHIQQRLFHTFGDRAVDNLLNAMSNTGPDHKWKKHRLQLIHGDMIRPDHIPLIKNKGAIVVQNPTHLAVPHLLMMRYGPERTAIAQPLKSLVDTGIPLALGSDGIGEIISPFVDIMFAVIHPTRPTEALTVEQALIAYTSGSAYAEFKEHIKGKLKPGMLADIAVLSQDIFSIPPDQFPATFSLLTLVDGEIVFNSGALSNR
jgi:predicted amidohydrolase YtcJ